MRSLGASRGDLTPARSGSRAVDRECRILASPSIVALTGGNRADNGGNWISEAEIASLKRKGPDASPGSRNSNLDSSKSCHRSAIVSTTDAEGAYNERLCASASSLEFAG